MEAVVISGGKGERLRPLTNFIPKVLMPLGEKSVIEVVIDSLLKHNCEKINLALGSEADYIESFVKSKEKYNGKVFFSREKSPLSVAGPIKLFEGKIKNDFIMMNGDVLIDLDFQKFFDHHLKSGKIATVGIFKEKIESERWAINIDEKKDILNHTYRPIHENYVCMGVIAFKPEVFEFIKKDESLGLPDLIDRMLKAGKKVGTYLVDGNWVHLRKEDDYQQAIKFYGNN
jgi:NDP-sugar pyrophosphorylase family protein